MRGEIHHSRWGLLQQCLTPAIFFLRLGITSPVFSLVLAIGNTGDARVLKSHITSPPWRPPSAASGGKYTVV